MRDSAGPGAVCTGSGRAMAGSDSPPDAGAASPSDPEPSPPEETGGQSSKQAVHARSVARDGSKQQQQLSTPPRGGSPPHDSPDSPELRAMLDQPPFALADFRKPIPTAAERLQQDVERVARDDPSLVRIHWERTGATDENVAQLVTALGSNTHVRTLHLEGNPAITLSPADEGADAAGLAKLETMLSSGSTAVTTLHLAGTAVDGDRIAALGRLCVANALRCVQANDATLHDLVLCGTGVGDDVAAALAAALPGNTALATVRFGSAGSDRRLTDAGAALLEASLPKCGVVTLTLGFTSVTPEKIRALHTLCIANAVRRLRANDASLVRLSWRNLTLNSGDEGLRDEDVGALAAALEGNTVLRSIDLWGNSLVSDQSANASSTASKGLARSVASSSVEWVRLDWTAVTDAGKDAVRKACVANAARNPEHAALFAGLPEPEEASDEG